MNILRISRNKRHKQNLHFITGMSQIMLILVLFLVMTGCRTLPPPGPHGHGRIVPPPPPPQVHFYNYLYYPDEQIYYDTDNYVYFYLTNNRWQRVTRLPISISLYNAIGISLRLETPQPYKFHHHHRKQHPSRKKYRRNRRVIEHHYWYYPDSQVYYDDHRHLYFYKTHKGWKQNTRLPKHIPLHPSYRERLILDTINPYDHHPKHIKRYPGKKGKFKNGMEPKYDHKGSRYDYPANTHDPRYDRDRRQDQPPVRQYRYRYYPDKHVYYDTTERIYFYRDGKQWQKARHLPAEIRLERERYNTIISDKTRPYKEHKKHRREYPSRSPHSLQQNRQDIESGRERPYHQRRNYYENNDPRTYETQQVPDKHFKKHEKRVQHSHKQSRFQYYPDAQVYYDIDKKVYYFRKGKSWRENRRLPKHIMLKGARSVDVNSETEKPYKRHHEYMRQYPPGRR